MATRSVEADILETAMAYHTAECPWYGDAGKNITVREYRQHIKDADCKPPDVLARALARSMFTSLSRGILSGIRTAPDLAALAHNRSIFADRGILSGIRTAPDLAALAHNRSIFADRGILTRLPPPNPISPDWRPISQTEPMPVQVTNLPTVQAVKQTDSTRPEGAKSKLFWIVVTALVATAIATATTTTFSMLI